MKPTCETCRYAEIVEAKGAFEAMCFCRRYAPARGGWVRLDLTDWCGEWAATEEAEADDWRSHTGAEGDNLRKWRIRIFQAIDTIEAAKQGDMLNDLDAQLIQEIVRRPPTKQSSKPSDCPECGWPHGWSGPILQTNHYQDCPLWSSETPQKGR